MNSALRTHGAPTKIAFRGSHRPLVDGKRGGGFTLLEMVIVLVVIAVLAAMSIPAFDSAVNEHKVREDGHQLAMMVREAMLNSAEQHRNYYIDLTRNTMTLRAEGDAVQQDSTAALFQDSSASGTNSDQPITDTASQPEVDVERQLDSDNKLKVPDPTKVDAWMDVPDDGTEWTFQPGELCPATKVRLVRGDAYLEMDFGALTGGIDTEKFYFP